MSLVKTLKTSLTAGFVAMGLFYMASNSFSRPSDPGDQNNVQKVARHSPEDFVGSETCRACHEDQFGSFAKTAHAKLSGWKVDRQGCESCHGPGKAHIEGGGDKSKIRTFENESPKQISETCLQCHAGKEEHNNFKRGEHWRNDVGCTDCHSPHLSSKLVEALAGTPKGKTEAPSSLAAVGPFSAHSNDLAPPKMLVKTEPQLCLTCHSETKAQFTQPFHHRVLEGAMNCSDCHNPHGGFELKQARLSTGADAACVKCHADKQGPFVFEHAPAKVEGCAICHSPHGSSNPKMLKRNNVNQLCLECHSDVAVKVGEIDAPGIPSFHNQATARFQNCTTCHMKIHGSNTHPFFFR
jgi:DmsE family decaheme c-type cytochrome